MPRTMRTLPLLLAAGLLSGALCAASGPGAAAQPSASRASTSEATAPDDPQAILARALDALTPRMAERRTTDAHVDASLALRQLFDVAPGLEAGDRATARSLLARPADGAADPLRNGYSTGSKRTCSSKICVHYVTSTADAPPSLRWVKKNLQTMQRVYNFEVGKLGYRPPVREPRRSGLGGNRKFDVYLKDLGLGVYGYCAPEYRVRGTSGVASGYCVLDNDFSRAEFRARPSTSLRVTAAHEFFHAIGFGYDFREDPWFTESTATWMEERFADNANDNRQYLPRSQVRVPYRPLDLFESNGTYHYGQWAFWEFLSQRYGNRIVRQVIGRAAEPRRGRNLNSIQALRATLKKRGGLPRVFAAYAAANTIPRRTYAEGASWPSSGLAASKRLGQRSRSLRGSVRLDHLSSTSVAARPDRTLRGKRWRLRVKVNGPGRATSPAAYVTVVTKRQGLIRRPLGLTRAGVGKLVVPFAQRRVKRVYVTVANVSTRTRCHQGTTLACQGRPLDDRRAFEIRLKVVK